MNIRNILWDVDGTLFDTYPAITYALSKALNGMKQSVALNVIDSLARESISHCIDTLSQRFKLDPELLRARFVKFYRTVDPSNQPPFPGVSEICQLIHERGGLNIAVTHRGVDSTKRLLDAHALSDCFDDIFSVEQGFPRKPDPAMVLAAIEKHSLNPDEILLIGDRGLDIQAGRAGGIRTGLFGKAEAAHSADLNIQGYSHLAEILENENQV
jgi:HAD superfamily hydrolase (TIGR01509 family)